MHSLYYEKDIGGLMRLVMKFFHGCSVGVLLVIGRDILSRSDPLRPALRISENCSP